MRVRVALGNNGYPPDALSTIEQPGMMPRIKFGSPPCTVGSSAVASRQQGEEMVEGLCRASRIPDRLEHISCMSCCTVGKPHNVHGGGFPVEGDPSASAQALRRLLPAGAALLCNTCRLKGTVAALIVVAGPCHRL
ncbi:hypothetical protein NDU88_001271 [Pleurodeles waltl]|uniref:Uncharacterized protein n=1 Tax=Pleurodeles waltl TaxID=8319 RepID=A0AAV7S9N4_PLEWA|nr:hypothetical protein NDU88_001271 [Pleurodeles waltl]